MAGGEKIFYDDDLKLTSSDESVAVVKSSSGGRRYVVEGKVLDLTVKDLGVYKSSGVMTILVTDAKDEYVLCTVKIPVEVN